MSHPSPAHATLPPRHLARGLLAACLAFGLGACAVAPPEPFPPAPLAEGWQAHSQPLFNQGPGFTAGTTTWKVSGLMPRGSYRLIDRRGDQARLVDGYRLEVDGHVMKDTYLFLPSGYGGIEAVEERYVLASAKP